MIRNILVPTDFSANAMKAAQYAALIAEKSGAKVYLLHERLEVEITRNRINDLKAFQNELQVACIILTPSKCIVGKIPGVEALQDCNAN